MSQGLGLKGPRAALGRSELLPTDPRQGGARPSPRGDSEAPAWGSAPACPGVETGRWAGRGGHPWASGVSGHPPCPRGAAGRDGSAGNWALAVIWAGGGVGGGGVGLLGIKPGSAPPAVGFRV